MFDRFAFFENELAVKKLCVKLHVHVRLLSSIVFNEFLQLQFRNSHLEASCGLLLCRTVFEQGHTKNPICLLGCLMSVK